MVDPSFWEGVEPHWDEGPPFFACYSKQLKADLLPGTFVLLTPDVTDGSASNVHSGVVARIVGIIATSNTMPARPLTVQVNIFKRLAEVASSEGILYPKLLQHLPEIVKMAELRVISCNDIVNLAFVFSHISLKDACNLFNTCQGTAIVFIVRFRFQQRTEKWMLTDVPDGHCLPFPSSYTWLLKVP
jgi:hypothetical protein